MDKEQSIRKRKSFRAWIKKVTAPKVAPAKFTDIKQGQGVFGVPLVASISYARATIGYQDADQINHQRAAAIPIIVAKCGSYLKRYGLETIGIFRLSGNMKRVNVLQHTFDSPNDSYGLHHNWDGYSLHDAASVFKRYLLQLPEPVITRPFYQKFRDVMNDSMYDKVEQRIDAFQTLICQLPTPHQHLLLYVLDLLRLFASNASITRMDASNLAAIFSAGLLHHPSHNSPIDYKISQRVIEFLIEFQSLFTMDLLVDAPIKSIEPDEALVSPNINKKNKQQRRKTESDLSPSSSPTSLNSFSIPLSASSEPPLLPPPVPTLPPHLKPLNKLSSTYIPQQQENSIISDSPTNYIDRDIHHHNDHQSIISNEDDDDDDNIPTPRPGSPIHSSYNQSNFISKLKYKYSKMDNIKHWLYLFNPGRLIWYTMICTITFTFLYEGYLIYNYVFILEPYFFFIGFFLNMYLLIYGINLSEIGLNDNNNIQSLSHLAKLHHQQQNEKEIIITKEKKEKEEDEESIKAYQLNDNYSSTSLPPSPTLTSPGRNEVDNDDGYSLFDDISILEDKETEEAMMKDEKIMANWQHLITRSWRASPDDINDINNNKNNYNNNIQQQQQQQPYPALGNEINNNSSMIITMDDHASVLSMSSRFNENIHYSDGDEDEDEDEDDMSNIDDAQLSLLWNQYEQFKNDEVLAEKLQKEEEVRSLEIQQKRDLNNPFVIQ